MIAAGLKRALPTAPLQPASPPKMTSPTLFSLPRLSLLHSPLAVGLDTISLGRKHNKVSDRCQTRVNCRQRQIAEMTSDPPMSSLLMTVKPSENTLMEDEKQRIAAMTAQMHLKHRQQQQTKRWVNSIRLAASLGTHPGNGNHGDCESDRSAHDTTSKRMEMSDKTMPGSLTPRPKPTSVRVSSSIRPVRLSSLSGHSLSPAGPRLPRHLSTTARSRPTRVFELVLTGEDDYNIVKDPRREYGMASSA